jgi:outer membrane protein assembly factor BamB
MLRLLTVLLFLVSSTAHGELLWQYSAGGTIAGNPVVHEESVYVTGGNSLHVLSRKGE